MSEAVLDDVPVLYSETARSYRSLIYSVLGVALGFGVDLLIDVGGGVAHLPGWLIFGAIIVAVHALLIYAVRATHSLTVTAEELRVGDEAVQRPHILGVLDAAPGDHGDDENILTLGWPNGRPRGIPTIFLRLVDERTVEVPTRSPNGLRGALEVGSATARIVRLPRPATEAELTLLPDIDERADAVFRVAGYELPEVPFDPERLSGARAVFVTGEPPVGFVEVVEVDGLAHVEALAVVPGSMRRGIGSGLLEAACDWAAGAGYPAVTLTTYADVPWNRPFYAGRGFAVVDGVTPGLAALRAREGDLGLDAVGRRVVMRREL